MDRILAFHQREHPKPLLGGAERKNARERRIKKEAGGEKLESLWQWQESGRREKEYRREEPSTGREGRWGGESRGKEIGDCPAYVFSSSAFLCLFCKQRQSHDQNIETMK